MRTLILIAASLMLVACGQQTDDTQVAQVDSKTAAEQAAAAAAETLAKAPRDTQGVVMIQYRTASTEGRFVIAQCGPAPAGDLEAFKAVCSEHISHMRLDDGRTLEDVINRMPTAVSWKTLDTGLGSGTVYETRIAILDDAIRLETGT